MHERTPRGGFIYEIECRTALWLQAREALWFKLRTAQSRESRFFLCGGNMNYCFAGWAATIGVIELGRMQDGRCRCWIVKTVWWSACSLYCGLLSLNHVAVLQDICRRQLVWPDRPRHTDAVSSERIRSSNYSKPMWLNRAFQSPRGISIVSSFGSE